MAKDLRMFSNVVKSERVGGIGTVSTILEVSGGEVLLEVEFEGDCLWEG